MLECVWVICKILDLGRFFWKMITLLQSTVWPSCSVSAARAVFLKLFYSIATFSFSIRHFHPQTQGSKFKKQKQGSKFKEFFKRKY